MTNVNPETILAKSGSIEGGGGSGNVGHKYEAPDRRPRHPLLEPGKFAKTGKDLAGELLMDACYKGDFTGVERLVGQSVDVNYQDDEESSPIMEAAAMGHTKIVKFLIKKGVGKMHINWMDNDGNTALSEAEANGHAAIVAALKKIGADHAKAKRA